MFIHPIELFFNLCSDKINPIVIVLGFNSRLYRNLYLFLRHICPLTTAGISCIIMKIALWRGLYQTVHLIHTKPIPPTPQYFNSRGMPVNPRSPALPVPMPSAAPLKLLPPVPMQLPVSAPNTRYPLRDFVKSEAKTVRATRKFLRTSIRKIYGIAWAIRKLHVEDAIDGLDNIRKKPAEWIKNIIKAGVRSAINIKGMSEDRLYIKEVILGKNTGIPGIRYHAKGKSGRMLRPKSQITVVLEEKTVEQLYKTIMTGRFSAGVANVLRNMLLDQNAGYQEIRDIQNLLTAKGRQQQKLMFKRKVEIIVKEKLEQGIVLDLEYAMDELMKEEAKKFAETYWEFKRQEAEKSIAERLEVYNKNLK